MGRNLAIVERSAAQEVVCYTWSFPGSPVQVQLRLAALEALEAREPESEGLLLGKAAGQTTEVHEFQAISATEPVSTETVSAAVETAGATAVMGYYRVTHEPVLRLSESDLQLMEAVFPARHQVFLLVQRTDSGPANATFFFRDEGRMCGDFPFLEFPFDAVLLAAAEQHRIKALERRLAESNQARRQAAAAQEPRRPKTAARVLSWGFAAALVVCLCLAAAVAGMKWLPERYRAWMTQGVSRASSTPRPEEASFGLHAERQNGDLKLTWNRESFVVLHATSGVLAIEDGGNSRKITLDPTQVRSGSILYAPSNDQVQMELSVLTPEGTVSESVLVILPKAGAPKLQVVTQRVLPAGQSETPPPAVTRQASALRPFTAPSTAPAPQAAINEPPPPTVRLSVTAALPAALAPRLTPPAPAPATVPKPNPVAAAPTSAPPVNEPPSANAPPTVPAAKPADEAMYYGPEVQSKVAPLFPSYLKAVVIKPTTIEVKVSIDAKGKVVKAEPASPEFGPPALVATATNAARLWRFKPAHRGPQPIPSELVLQFLFRPPQ